MEDVPLGLRVFQSLCIGLFVLTFVVVYIRFIFRSRTNELKERKQAWERWESSAQDLGLQHTPHKTFWGTTLPGALVGARDGFHVSITKRKRGQTRIKGSNVYTTIETRLPSRLNGVHMRITPFSMLYKAARHFGLTMKPALQTGEKHFDNTFRLKTKTPKDLLKHLNPQVRQQLLRVSTNDDALEVTEEGVRQEWNMPWRRNWPKDTTTETLDQLINAQVELLKRLQQANNAHITSQTDGN